VRRLIGEGPVRSVVIVVVLPLAQLVIEQVVLRPPTGAFTSSSA
jgi:hypothetical protein